MMNLLSKFRLLPNACAVFALCLPSIALSQAPAEGQAAKRTWTLKLEDVRIDKAMKRWAKEAGYSFRWDADRYVLIAAPTEFQGDFVDAVKQALETPGIAYSEYPLEACIYQNIPPLLRVTRLGDQAQECQ